MTKLVSDMCVGLKDIAKHQIALLKNISGETIETNNGDKIPKDHLLGDIQFSTKISNVFNYMREGVDSQNRLTQLINYKASKLPQFASIPLAPYITDWQRCSLKRESIEEYQDSKILKQIDEQEKQKLLTPPPPPPQQKPSESISFKDLPPEGQVQMAAQAGIQIAPPQPIGIPGAAAPVPATVPQPTPIMPGVKI
jgi:hypothetical protein